MADVLVVEAENLTRRLLETRLACAGHGVRAVASAAGALELLARAGCPDVLVTDAVLPDGSGPELAARLRSEPGAADLPVIVLGAPVTDPRTPRVPGAVRLPTPFSAEALADAVTEVLRPVDAAIEATVRSRLAAFGRLDELERELIAELLAAFVQRAPATSSAIERASATGDADGLQSAVRRLAAAARNLGADDLVSLCAEIGGGGPVPTPLAARLRRVLGSTCRVFAGLAAEFRNEPLDAALVGAAHA